MNPGAMAKKRYSAFPKAPALLEPCLVSDPGHSLGGESPCILQPQRRECFIDLTLLILILFLCVISFNGDRY